MNWVSWIDDDTEQPGISQPGVFFHPLLFVLWQGAQALLKGGAPLAPEWLAAKALLFGLIFAAAIMIEVACKPVGRQLVWLLKQGSSDAMEISLRAHGPHADLGVDRRLLLVDTSCLGATKPF